MYQETEGQQEVIGLAGNLPEGMIRRNNCRLCSSTEIKLIYSLGSSALANDFVSDPNIAQNTYPLDLYQCSDCGHFQLLDIVDPEILFRNYCYVSGTSKLMRQHFRNLACSIVSEFDLDKDLVVEIGSNDGTLLGWFKALGIPFLGVEPATNLANQCNERGLTTINAFFNTQTAKQILDYYDPPKIIIANNIFAHADDLSEIVNAVKLLMRKDGVFIFEVSYFADVIETGDFSQIYHEHCSFHSIKPLISFFLQHQMTMFRVERIPTHGGSIRVYVRNNDANQSWDDGSDLKFANQETLDGLYDLKKPSSIFHTFTKRIEQVGVDLKSHLTKLKQEGKTIAAAGASAKSTTLLHHYDIGIETLDFIADDAPEKQGFFSPGKKIPILPFNAIYDKKPDYLLILSYNFTDFLIQKHNKYEGTWIIPFPEYKEVKGHN
jgi:hypothetical protein